MAAFLVDEHVTPRLGERLARHGHAAHHVRALGFAGANDASILLVAAERGLILITENHQDFLTLHEAWQLWPRAWRVSPPPAHQGILTSPQLPVARLDETAAAIAHLASSVRAVRNELHRWSPVRGWELHRL